jgi:hypothetical protein
MARRDQCPARYLSLAGFEVTIIGRFWVTAEDFDPPVQWSSAGSAHGKNQDEIAAIKDQNMGSDKGDACTAAFAVLA